VQNVSSFSLQEWMAEFERLKKLNGAIMGKSGKPGAETEAGEA
jgi:hypothetical protein